MATMSMNGADYVGYEYKEKVVNQKRAEIYRNCYPCFGWEEVSNELQSDAVGNMEYVMLRFRRERKICNRMELTRLQKNFENCMNNIEKLEQRKESKPSVYALINGVTGFLLLVTGIYLCLIKKWLAIAVIFILFGMIACVSAIFVYRVLFQQQMNELSPLIEIQYDEVYEICEKGSRLLI